MSILALVVEIRFWPLLSILALILAFCLPRLNRKRRDKEEQVAYKLEQEIALWEPGQNVNHAEGPTKDPFKTLFVSRINFYTSESKLRREFEQYGSIKDIVLVHDSQTGKPRGYAFIEYEHERDMHCECQAHSGYLSVRKSQRQQQQHFFVNTNSIFGLVFGDSLRAISQQFCLVASRAYMTMR